MNETTTIDFLPVVDRSQIEIVNDLAKQIWDEYYTPIIGEQQVTYMLENFQSSAAIITQIDAGMQYYVMSQSGLALGYYAVQRDENEPSLKISKLYVKRKFRRHGYGEKAMAHIEHQARYLHLKFMWLTVNRQNHAALKFYRQMNFRNVGECVQDIGAGFVMDDYKLVKNLAA